MSVSAPLPHDAATLHVTGAARYVDDLPVPANCLHLAFGLSTVAAGRIGGMDLAAVRAAPGVAAVLTAADLRFANDVSPSVHDEPLLAVDRVHYLGQPLFVVVADSHLAARAAARLGSIEITEETPILTIDEAMDAGSRFEGGPIVWQIGDTDAAMEAAPHRLSGSLEIGGQEHFYLEGQAALALPSEDGDMEVHSSTQHPTEIQHKVADAIGRPMHAVRVVTRRMGGGFGGKESQGNALACAVAVAAAATGQPCKMRYDRDDDMTITGKRHDLRILWEAGFDDDGRLRAMEFTHLVRCGWSQDLSLPVADRAMLHADNAYHLPAARITSHRLRTNTQSATAFRGFGGPQGMVGIERVMDAMARHLGLDPALLRRRNYYAAGARGGLGAPRSGSAGPSGDRSGRNGAGAADPATEARHADPAAGARLEGGDLASRGAAKTSGGSRRTEGSGAGHGTESGTGTSARQGGPASGAQSPPGPGTLTPYGMEVTDFILHEMTDRLLETSGYAARRAAVAEWNAAHDVLKRGIAFSPVKFGISFTLTHLNQAGALVHVYQDGSIHLNHGGTEMGQGLNRKVAQVAAARFGVPPEAVKITATDTGKVPNTSATAASSGSDLNGMAAQAACDAIRGRIADCLGTLYQADPASVRFADGAVEVAGERLSFARAAQIAYQNRVSLSATGFYKTPEVSWDRAKGRGRPFFYFAYGCAVTEVVIDTLTGENRILRADILHDCGRSLNPALDRGQIEGGYVQGAGWLTTEELVWDARGRLMTHAPSTYKIPACSDRPDILDVALWDGDNPVETVYRSKAVGEPPLMLGISAWLALMDACAACGPHDPGLNAPATAEEVLAAAGRARGNGCARGWQG